MNHTVFSGELELGCLCKELPEPVCQGYIFKLQKRSKRHYLDLSQHEK